jgi:hypothetical protein
MLGVVCADNVVTERRKRGIQPRDTRALDQEEASGMIKRYRVSMGNFPGAPGVATHYVSDSVTDFTPFRTFYQVVTNHVPNGMNFSFPTTVDVLDETNGQIQITQSATVLATVTSAVAAAPFSGTSGLITRWITPDYVEGKHVVGRTYLVPLAQGSYDAQGSIASGTITAIQTAALALVAATSMVVWTRPRAASTNPPVTARPGSAHPVTNAIVPDLACVMRSRRT